jgi:hypothetical protein
MSTAAVAVRSSDGIVAHCSDDGIIGCFEGSSAADEAHAAGLVVLDTATEQRATYEDFPQATVALDHGAVHFMRYAERLPPDPQGPTMERCRRLAAIAGAGTALATTTFRDELGRRDAWKGLPKLPIPGLEGERLYQLKGYGQPFKWTPMIRVEAGRYDQLRDRLDDYEYRISRKDAQIARLEQLMREITGDVDAKTGELTRILTDAKTEELRCRAGDLRRAELAALVPLLANGAAGYRAVLESQRRLAQLVAELQQRYPDQDWSDVDFWIRLLAIPTTDPE